MVLFRYTFLGVPLHILLLLIKKADALLPGVTEACRDIRADLMQCHNATSTDECESCLTAMLYNKTYYRVLTGEYGVFVLCLVLAT